MTLLAGGTYDPATAVATRLTSAAAVTTALDTTNLRRSFTVPSNGAVLVHMRGVFHGGTTVPSILLAVMNGATVVSRVAPSVDAAGTIAAATRIPFVGEWVIAGLTPGQALTWDAAYSVEVAGSGAIKWGGPNTAADDAFGGFSYNIFDVL